MKSKIVSHPASLLSNELNESFEELLNLPNSISSSNLEFLINSYLDQRKDRTIAASELDKKIALLSNFLSLLSLKLKMDAILADPFKGVSTNDISQFYTRKELAQAYRVTVRTVANWISAGLEVVKMGGIERISKSAVQEFVASSKAKKFNWKSIAGQHLIKKAS